jgi:mRNA interferase MazF
VVVSRDALNEAVPRVIVAPCTTYRTGRTIYPSQVLLRAPDGGLTVDSLAMGDQLRTLAVGRLVRRRGRLSAPAMKELDRALSIALDLPGQG